MMLRSLLLIGALGLPVAAAAQTTPAVSGQQLATYVKVHSAIGALRDRYQAEFARSENKKIEAQEALHAKLRADVAKVLAEHGLSDAEYKRITYVLSIDGELRKAFDQQLGIAAPEPVAPAVTMSSNPHIGHVLTSFNGTPNNQGLLPLTLAEANVVVQHAALASRNTGSLDALRLHAGHILHAVDPAAGATGPGSGYGLKKAAAALAAHIELAAKTAGVSPAVATHAVHVAASARNTLQRAEQIADLARQIQAATNAGAAAELFARLHTIAGQLLPGADANGDGRIGWEQNEGGLQHVEQHIKLMGSN